MILVGDPLDRRQDPRTLVDGQFSMPFLAAVMLRKGSFGWSDFEEYLPDPGIQRACKIVVPVCSGPSAAYYLLLCTLIGASCNTVHRIAIVSCVRVRARARVCARVCVRVCKIERAI